jgi:phage recombination protein Bet
MTTLATIPDRLQVGKMSYTRQQLDLIWRTAAKDCDQTEFSQFIHVCGSVQLDPMRKQIYAFVFSKGDKEKRQMAIITAIGGYRTIAARSGNYRPDNRVPRITYDESAIDPHKNPKGIVKAEVSVYVHAHGAWFEVPHEVEWEAYAPIVKAAENEDDYEWVETGEVYPAGHAKAGKPKFRKKMVAGAQRVERLDPGKPRWFTDGAGMLAKCAEAGALRKAFPDDFGGVYDETEMDRAHSIDLSAAEYAESAAVESRLAMIGGKDSILFDFHDDRGLHPIALGKIHGECEAFLRAHPEIEAIEAFEERNMHALRDFWARSKNDALDIKQRIEALKAAAKKGSTG